ncbi:Twin-arginine translocation pathway signal, partial [Escherichia coli]|nr:Twin-arginine translocation pathway signal [Escherichia coli]
LGLDWEEHRLKLLRQIEDTPFFQTIRGGLVTGIYNQKELWPLFGYEGESYSKGGYIARGFSDIEWL